ncbi:sugar phosphate isomerase/epimerase family protein [Aquipuribacter hungaricus]|uniref:Sugar phosphate isomerase/epimerase family protein n=1 Tax=Aquipuribacter hungaricus TaxID=545624 RepID=A0ABV7WH23_9MICO
MHPTAPRRALAGLAALTLAATGVLASVSGASAAPRGPGAADCAGRSIPASKISIQLFSYASWSRAVGTEQVLAELEEIGYRNVEPFGGSYEGRDAETWRALLKEYGLKQPSSHGSVATATFGTTLDFAKTVGQKYVGSGGFPAPSIARDGSSSYADVIATAEAMDALGEQSVKNGTGKLFGHNHQWEFTTLVTNPETGETTTAWEVLVQNTDPRWVTFQLDVFWAADAGADVVALLEEYGGRIELLHIKDGDLAGDARGIPSDVGEGELDWDAILGAAQGHVKYYVVERDGAPADAEFARDSFEFLTCTSF